MGSAAWLCERQLTSGALLCRYSYLDFIRYAWGAIMVNQYGESRPEFLPGMSILEYYSFEVQSTPHLPSCGCGTSSPFMQNLPQAERIWLHAEREQVGILGLRVHHPGRLLLPGLPGAGLHPARQAVKVAARWPGGASM